MDEFDIGGLLPEFDSFLSGLDMFIRICVVAGPLVLLGLGLYYLLAAPKEANYSAGYRFHYGMAKARSWQFMQYLAGAVYSVVGLAMTVVMVVMWIFLQNLDLMTMATEAIRLIAWQAVIIFVATLGINVTMIVLFDSEGNRRGTKRSGSSPKL